MIVKELIEELQKMNPKSKVAFEESVSARISEIKDVSKVEFFAGFKAKDHRVLIG